MNFVSLTDMNAIARDASVSKMFLPPLSFGVYSRTEKKLLPRSFFFFSLKDNHFSRWIFLKIGKQTGTRKSYPFLKMAKNLPVVSSVLNAFAPDSI